MPDTIDLFSEVKKQPTLQLTFAYFVISRIGPPSGHKPILLKLFF